MNKRILILLVTCLVCCILVGCSKKEVEKTKEQQALEYIESKNYSLAIKIYAELNDTENCKKAVSLWINSFIESNLYNNAMSLKEKYAEYYDFDNVLIDWEQYILDKEKFDDNILKYQFDDSTRIKTYFALIKTYYQKCSELNDNQAQCIEDTLMAIYDLFKTVSEDNCFELGYEMLNTTIVYEEFYYEYLEHIVKNKLLTLIFFQNQLSMKISLLILF